MTEKDKDFELRHLNQFIVHAALDCVQEIASTTNQSYLKIVDKFNQWLVSAYILPSGIRFMLLHDASNTDGIRHFFQEVHELYVKLILNPFQAANQPLQSNAFDHRVRQLGRKWL